ncbi:hypothetical protein BT96DRAFT_914515 [Gymnopus androsaceus JB14]|uniref:Dipeptidylpeptidase IV N-terminal domain-containing protein n=1 Tax=Gymnopus androsaceus JB14 TaxID=1447944 RepID=A0A6A4IE01_9AGAR|nr:hypothetical protein BT96DRAFT_914515 [Gymnopus androsaceus JB14]
MRFIQHVFLAVTMSVLFARALPITDDGAAVLERNLEGRIVQPAFAVDLETGAWLKKREEDTIAFSAGPDGTWLKKREEDTIAFSAGPDGTWLKKREVQPAFAVDLVTGEWIKKREEDVERAQNVDF